MKLFSTALAALALLATAVNGSPMEEQASSCTLSGTYKSGTDISSCSTLTIGTLSVPAGVTLDLSKAKTGATIKISGTVTFGQKKWAGPLVLLGGSNLSVSGS
ncbi:Polygalacturonase, partial [Phytophthora megakarya]